MISDKIKKNFEKEHKCSLEQYSKLIEKKQQIKHDKFIKKIEKSINKYLAKW